MNFQNSLPKSRRYCKSQPWEFKEYPENTERVGAMGHVCTDEQYETFRLSGAIPDDPVGEAEDIILVERIRKLLFK